MMNNNTVEAMVAFQWHGTGFGGVWQDIQPVLEEKVRRELRNRLVRGHKTAADEAAVDDTLQEVVYKLLQLPGKPRSWFDPKKGRGTDGVSALTAWLSRIAANETVAHCRAWRDAGRKKKVIPLSHFELSDPIEDHVSAKPDLAKLRIDEAELSDVMNECVDSLKDEAIGRMVRLRLQENLSERNLAERLRMNVTTVHRRLHAAYKLLLPLLKQRGVDRDWRPGIGFYSTWDGTKNGLSPVASKERRESSGRMRFASKSGECGAGRRSAPAAHGITSRDRRCVQKVCREASQRYE